MNEYIKILALIYLVAVLLLWLYAFRTGKRITNYLHRRYPARWEELGKPAPHYTGGPALQQWHKFITHKGYLVFEDRRLSEMCGRQRRLERILFLSALGFFVIFGAIALWHEYA